MPNNPRGGGVLLRRVECECDQELRETMDKLDVSRRACDFIIARTAGIGRTVGGNCVSRINRPQTPECHQSAGSSAPGAFLIYHGIVSVIRAIRDYFQPDIGEVLFPDGLTTTRPPASS